MGFSKEDTKAIKGIAIVFMIYHHLFAFPERAGRTWQSLFSLSGEPIAYWIGDFGKICVAVFMFLAGYGTWVSCEGKENTVGIIKEKIKRLYFTYWKVFFLFIPICMIAGVPKVSRDIGLFIKNLLGIRITYVGEWWFFQAYILLLILFPLIRQILRRKENMFFANAVAISCIWIVVHWVVPAIPTQGDSCLRLLATSEFAEPLTFMINQLPIFLAGCFFAKYDVLAAVKKKFVGNYLCSVGAAAILCIVFFMRRNMGSFWDFVFAPVVIGSCTVLLHTRGLKWFYVFLQKLGNESTIIWLTHTIYCYLLIPKVIYAPRFSVLIAVWLLVLSCLTSIIIKKLYKGLGKIGSALYRKFDFEEK